MLLGVAAVMGRHFVVAPNEINRFGVECDRQNALLKKSVTIFMPDPGIAITLYEYCITTRRIPCGFNSIHVTALSRGEVGWHEISGDGITAVYCLVLDSTTWPNLTGMGLHGRSGSPLSDR